MWSTLGLVFVFSGLLEILIPLVFSFYVLNRLGVGWKVWLVGAAMFLLSLVRIPLNQFLSQIALGAVKDPWGFVILALVPSTTAGVFEETARYIGLRYWVKDDSYEKGLAYGAGHGGIESIIIVGVNVLALGVILLISPGQLPPTQLEQLLGTPLFLPLVGVYERVIVIIIQVAFSVMVLESIRKKQARYLGGAVVLHVLLDFLAVFLSRYGVLYSELAVTVFALALGYWLVRVLRDENVIERFK